MEWNAKVFDSEPENWRAGQSQAGDRYTLKAESTREADKY